MGWAFTSKGEKRMLTEFWYGNRLENREEVICKDEKWLELASYRAQWWALVQVVKKLQVLLQERNFIFCFYVMKKSLALLLFGCNLLNKKYIKLNDLSCNRLANMLECGNWTQGHAK
jgi:hypothetical protein